jgi:hypothetical protein
MKQEVRKKGVRREIKKKIRKIYSRDLILKKNSVK